MARDFFEVTVFAANGPGEVQPMRITAAAPLPNDFEGTNMLGDAIAIVDAMRHSLPQGTIDNVFALLAKRACSRVTFRSAV